MKVNELIKELEKMPGDYRVYFDSFKPKYLTTWQPIEHIFQTKMPVRGFRPESGKVENFTWDIVCLSS